MQRGRGAQPHVFCWFDVQWPYVVTIPWFVKTEFSGPGNVMCRGIGYCVFPPEMKIDV